MIHIDDLVRHRLEGGEEPERPGAWLTMRALLDKEMPVAVAAGASRRRIIGYFTGLLILATASVGGYKMYTHSFPDVGVSGGGAGASVVKHNNLTASNNPNTNNGRNSGKTTVSSPAPSSDKSLAPAANYATIASGNTNADASSLTQTVRNNRSSRRHAGTNSTNTALQNAPSPVALNARENSASPMSEASAVSSARSNDLTERHHVVPQQNDVPANASSERIFASSAAGATARNRRAPVTKPEIQSNNTQLMPASSTAASARRSLPAPAPARLMHDTIESIKLVAHRIYDASTQRTVFRIDTFPKDKIVLARVAPQPETVASVAPSQPVKHHAASGHRQSPARSEATSSTVATNNQTTADKMQNIPLIPASKVTPSEAAVAADNSTSLVALSKFKVSSKRFLLWDAEKVDETIKKVQFSLARMQMYTGMMGGLNASVFTPNALGGLQVGFTCLFILNDWWSLMTEIKYMHRFNTGNTVRDDYMNIKAGSESTEYFTASNGEPYVRQIWQDEHVDHYFNYEVVRSFEMPIALRYNFGRFYTQGGLNLVYSSKIDAKEVTHARGDFSSHNISYPVAIGPQPLTNSTPQVTIADFDSRFGTGYVLGGGFMFTPAVYLDARVSQTFWDNANTPGAKQISKDLLRTPSIQLSAGYRFGSPKR